MPRFRPTLLLELCAAIVALSGCGSDSEPSSPLGASAATVTGVGSIPVPTPAKLRTLEDQPVRARVVATDADDDTLTFAVKRAPAHATITLDDVTGVYELRPAPNYF